MKIIHLLIVIFALSFPEITFGTQTTYTFYATGDTFVKGFLDGHQDDNEGGNVSLRIQHVDRFSNVFVKFSQAEIIAAIGTNHVASAHLELYTSKPISATGDREPMSMLEECRLIGMK